MCCSNRTCYPDSEPTSLLFLLSGEAKQQIPILQSLVWLDRSSNPRSTGLEGSTLTTDVVEWPKDKKEKKDGKPNNGSHNTTQKIKDWETQTTPNKGCTQYLRRGKQFLLHYSNRRVVKERTGVRVLSVKVNKVLLATLRLSIRLLYFYH
jgi:hypothetical protein